MAETQIWVSPAGPPARPPQLSFLPFQAPLPIPLSRAGKSPAGRILSRPSRWPRPCLSLLDCPLSVEDLGNRCGQETFSAPSAPCSASPPEPPPLHRLAANRSLKSDPPCHRAGHLSPRTHRLLVCWAPCLWPCPIHNSLWYNLMGASEAAPRKLPQAASAKRGALACPWVRKEEPPASAGEALSSAMNELAQAGRLWAPS